MDIASRESGVTVGKMAFPDSAAVNWLPAADESSDTAVAAAPSDSTDAPEDSTQPKGTEASAPVESTTPPSIKVGDTIEFGKYEQDNNTRNGAEIIEWRVLAVEDGKALIISEYGLAAKPYNETYTSVTWETCTLRKWLNNDFYNSAFTTEEKSRIKSTTLVNKDNPDYGTDGGNNTVDKVFLLSLEEAEKYFADDDARMMEGTAYAKANGLYPYSGNGSSWWWLRSPGSDQRDAAGVHRGGWLSGIGDHVNYPDCAVRPALWINL